MARRNYIFKQRLARHSTTSTLQICFLRLCCPIKKFRNKHIYLVKGLLYAAVTWQSKKRVMFVYLIETKACSSLFCVSSSFLFKVGIVHRFVTVNHLDMVETGHMLTPSTCSRSPASSFPVLRKAGRGPGNEATHSSGRTGE